MAGDKATPEVILEVRGASKRFGKVQALENVSLAFHKGEIHTLLGENGAGKTTLMNIIYGLYHADGGEILVYGKKQDVRTPKDSLRLGIGMVPQTFKLVPDKMKRLISDLPGLWSQVQAELSAFADFLSELAHANQA